LADHHGRAFGTMCRLSVCNACIVAKRYGLPKLSEQVNGVADGYSVIPSRRHNNPSFPKQGYWLHP